MYNITFNGVLTLLNLGIAIIIIKMYFGIFFTKKDSNIRGYALWILYVFWHIVSSYISFIPSFLNPIISIILIFCLTACTYKGVQIKKLMFSILLVALWMLMELLTAYIFIFCGIDYRFPRLLGSLISECITLIIIFVLKKFFNNKKIKDLPIGYSALLMLVSIGSMFVIYNFFIY